MTIADRMQPMVLKFRDVLSETERLASDKLQAYQLSLLTPLLLHAQRNVPFYKGRLDAVCRGGEINMDRWRELPVLTRSELQRNFRALNADQIPPYAGEITFGETSGSTGRPVKYAMNELAAIASVGATDRSFRWWDFDGEKTMASFVARGREGTGPPDGKTERGWRPGSNGLHHMLDLSADVDERIAWLKTRSPDYLTGHSFVLLNFAERALQRGCEIALERITSIGTVLTDDIRDACERAFGARPIDQYGAQETGLLATECPWCKQMHAHAEIVLVELLDDDGAPSRPGTLGRVVVTPFYNYAMPLVRYEVGDLAITGAERVKCPLKLPAFGPVKGRYRNAFTLADGRTVIPYIPVGELRKFISFEQYQVVQTGPDTIEIRYVPDDPSATADQEGLEACVRKIIDPSFSVRAVVTDRIERSASGKYEDYVSLVPKPAR